MRVPSYRWNHRSLHLQSLWYNIKQKTKLFLAQIFLVNIIYINHATV